MNPIPRESEVPLNSRVAQLLQGANFYDAWRISTARVERSALEHFLAAAEKTPRWVNAAMGARNRVVQLLGLKNLGALDNLERARAASTYQPGDRVGIFTLFEVTLTTVVHVKNLLGHLYMLPVTPAHRIIAPAVLAGIAEHPHVA